MIYTESEMVELKSVYVDSIKKEIVAFANTHGGTIYIGVEDDGEVCGIDHSSSSLINQINRNAIFYRFGHGILLYHRTKHIDGCINGSTGKTNISFFYFDKLKNHSFTPFRTFSMVILLRITL